MEDHPRYNGPSARTWALVVLAAAILGGPFGPKVLEVINEYRQRSSTNATLGVPLYMTQLISEADLRGKSQWELDLMRNEIFARHGRLFDRPDLQAHFDTLPWYHGRIPPDRFRLESLTPIERANANLIARYQGHTP